MLGPSAEEVARARAFLRERFPMTRLLRASSLSEQLGADIYLKLESELPTGSFKVRGATFALAGELAAHNVSEVVTSSTGNHGAAVAYAAQMLGIPASVFLPERPNPQKRERIASFGARIVEIGNDLTAAAAAAREYANESGAFYLDDITNPDVAAATGTIAAEIVEQEPDVRALIVPMGDTALIRGIASTAKRERPGMTIVGVQAAAAPSYYLSWKKGAVVVTETCDTIADGLATRTPDGTNVQAIRELVDDVVLVTDDEMLDAMRLLKSRDGIVAEPAGAAATAAALKIGNFKSPVAVLVTGCNVSAEVAAQLERGVER